MKQKISKQNKQKKFAKGFTLIELLVVVLIIGILAAIALPQYQMAVAKSKYSPIKGRAKSVAEAVTRFYLTNNRYPTSYTDLDLDFTIISKYEGENRFSFKISQNQQCNVWGDGVNMVACYNMILGQIIGFYAKTFPYKASFCYADSIDTEDKVNKFCQKETGKINGNCTGTYCVYYY